MRLLVGLMACLLVSACGIKPGGVSAPGGEGSSDFPRTYPNTAHDPQPQDFTIREK